MFSLTTNLMLHVPGWLYVIAMLLLVGTNVFSRLIRAASYLLAGAAATGLYFSTFHDLSSAEVEKLRSEGLLTDCVIEKTINPLNDQKQYLPIAGKLTYQKIQTAIYACNLPTDKKIMIEKLKPTKTIEKEAEQ